MSGSPPEVEDWIRSAIIISPQDIWGNLVTMGLHELAARMTGLGIFDRRGDVLFFDTFESGLNKGNAVTDGTGAAVEISSYSARFGNYSLKLTAGSDGLRLAIYQYFLPYHIPSKFGLEASFAFDENAEYLEFGINLSDGVDYHTGTIRYDDDNNRVQYKDSTGTWQDLITGVSLGRGARNYHTLKMVVDLVNDKYHRVLLDKWSWTDGDLALVTGESVVTPIMYADVNLYGASGVNAVAYFDGVLITQNEPT